MKGFRVCPLPCSGCRGHNHRYDRGMRAFVRAGPCSECQIRRYIQARFGKERGPMKPWTTWLARLGIAGACLMVRVVAAATCPMRALKARQRLKVLLPPAQRRPKPRLPHRLKVRRSLRRTRRRKPKTRPRSRLPRLPKRQRRLQPRQLLLRRRQPRLLQSLRRAKAIRVQPRCWPWRPVPQAPVQTRPQAVQPLPPAGGTRRQALPEAADRADSPPKGVGGVMTLRPPGGAGMAGMGPRGMQPGGPGGHRGCPVDHRGCRA